MAKTGLYGHALAGWRERAAKANELHRTCVECGATGLEVVKQTPDVEGIRAWMGTRRSGCAQFGVSENTWDRIRQNEDYRPVPKISVPCSCGGRGHNAPEVAEAIGCSRGAAYEYLNDPDRSKARARRESLKVPCVECLQPIDGGQGVRQTYRCKWCKAGEPSPRVRETTATGFREFAPSTSCGCGCGGQKAPGHHVCAGMAERLARVRVIFELEGGADWFRDPLPADDSADDFELALAA